MLQKIKSFLFENKSTRQTLAKNTLWLAVGQVGSRLVRAAILVYAARVLGASEYGIFSYALSLAGFFTIFADLGVSTILTREASQRPAEKHVYFSTSFVLKGLLVLGSAALVAVGAPYLSKIPAATALVPLVALLVIADGVRDFTGAFFRAEQKMEREAFVTVITNVAIAVFGFIILYYSRNAHSLMFTYVASAAFGTLASIYLVKEEFAHFVANFRPGLIRQILRDAYPMTVAGVLGTFMLNTDLIMIGWWRGAAEIGMYAAPQRIIGLLYTLPAIFASASFPVFSRAVGQGNLEKVRKLMEYGMAAVLGLSIPVAVGGILLGKEIMLLAFGPGYLAGTLSFQLMLATVVLTFSIALQSNYILAFNAQRKGIIAAAAGAAGNVIFNILFIPKWGIAGSAASTVLAQILNVGLLWWVNKKVNYFETLRHLKKIVAATIVMAALVLGLKFLEVNVIVNILLSGAVYAGVLLLLREKLLKEIASTFQF